MPERVAQFLLLVLLGLLAGTMFGVWVGFNPLQLSPSTYVEQQQTSIRALNTLLPAMGATSIFLAAFLAVRCKNNSAGRNLWVAVGLLLLIAAVITRLVNQPINAIVITWSMRSPPLDWAQLRDRWWQWHILRTVFAIGAFALSVVATLLSRKPNGA